MNQADYMVKMPQSLRKQIEAEPVYASWLKQGYTLERLLTDPVAMETVYNRMTDRERRVLQLIVSRIGCEPFDAGRLEKLAAPVMSGADAKVGFLLLLRKGICFTFRKSWGEHTYVMSHDALALWQRILYAAEPENGVTGDHSPAVELTEAGGLGLAHDMFQMLVYLHYEGVKLTKSGTFHKRHLQKLNELLSLRDDAFEGTGIKYAYADVYPLTIAVMLECLTRLKLLEQRGEELALGEAAARQWLALTEAGQTAVLYSLWRPVAFPAAVWLQHAALWLERWPTGIWLHADDLLRWLDKHKLTRHDEVADSAESQTAELERQWIKPLVAFGWMEKGRTPLGDSCYRWRMNPVERADEEQNDGRFYVQPDFEVLVPPDVPFAARWELAAFADLRKLDSITVYALSKNSLQRGLESGRTVDGLIRFLTRYAMYELPDNVRLTLEQWSKPFGKLSLSQAILLRCDTPDVADNVARLPGAADCFIERLGDCAWLVKPDKLKPLGALLDKSGWMPGKLALLDGTGGRLATSAAPGDGCALKLADQDGKLATTAADSWQELPVADKGFIYSRHSVGYFEMEQRLPHIAELYPDLNGVPAGWMKDYRTYHASTRREIVEKALEWKAALQVRLDGQDRFVAPRKLQETRGTWSMVGLEQSELQEVSLLADQWQEMKMIVPGINDI